MDKSRDAFRTISEVADWLGTPTHVLRFWESRFSQVKPVKRAGGRRYYRPDDMELLGGIKKLLHDDGLTIRGVQKILREQGVKHVAALSQPIDAGSGDTVPEAGFAQDVVPETPTDNVVAMAPASARVPDTPAATPDAAPEPAEAAATPTVAEPEQPPAEPPVEPETAQEPERESEPEPLDALSARFGESLFARPDRAASDEPARETVPQTGLAPEPADPTPHEPTPGEEPTPRETAAPAESLPAEPAFEPTPDHAPAATTPAPEPQPEPEPEPDTDDAQPELDPADHVLILLSERPGIAPATLRPFYHRLANLRDRMADDPAIPPET
jgi:DNA-binding transcriptional MerR regulator